jgi:hypothetical protein
VGALGALFFDDGGQGIHPFAGFLLIRVGADTEAGLWVGLS